MTDVIFGVRDQHYLSQLIPSGHYQHRLHHGGRMLHERDQVLAAWPVHQLEPIANTTLVGPDQHRALGNPLGGRALFSPAEGGQSGSRIGE
jgi:hypothetical protein